MIHKYLLYIAKLTKLGSEWKYYYIIYSFLSVIEHDLVLTSKLNLSMSLTTLEGYFLSFLLPPFSLLYISLCLYMFFVCLRKLLCCSPSPLPGKSMFEICFFDFLVSYFAFMKFSFFIYMHVIHTCVMISCVKDSQDHILARYFFTFSINTFTPQYFDHSYTIKHRLEHS